MDWLKQRAAATPHKVALIIGDQQWSYQQLDGFVEETAVSLHSSGVAEGDLVAVLLPSGLGYVCLIHALARLGATLVPLNTRLTVAELAWQLAFTEAAWLVFDETEAERVAELQREVTGFSALRIEQKTDSRQQITDNAAHSQFTTHNSQFTISNSQQYRRATLRPTINDWPQLQMERTQAIVFTSGTTGKPKGVMLSFGNHFWSATASTYRLGLDPTDRWISCLPLFHVGGLAVIFRSCLYGTAVILHPRFDIKAINHSIDAQLGTMISVVPTMLHRLLQSRTAWPSTLRLILVGGAAATPELVQAASELRRINNVAERRFARQSTARRINSQQSTANSQQSTNPQPPAPSPQPPSSQFTIHNSQLISTTYGLTEAASQVATQTPADTVRKPGCVGKPLMFTTVAVVDENGRSLPPNEIGEIVVSGPTVMRGYFKNEAATATALKNGRLHTGDMGYLDDDGDLWLVQRRSDLIVSGGENVYPAEVEAALRQHPAVAAVCVIGVPDAEWGQKVAAMVVREKGADLDAEMLEEYGRSHLAGYKQPRLIRFVNELPLTGSGKVHRQAVKDQLTIDN